ncbi:bifunctional diguanylate cyclase/phosphodiesterase [Vreelandella rituensis]|uniref:Bifunctional diguanylate cyclase/phosphodiesterase n=1 Tax=Vreelandella rituensis TaxID=2282306 RepID=A0A368TP44_9GAMM|nr:bifunctional diguanylate cyclase/phosphodiesterase [Halomonas rituensis]RCV86320.1 bifunctional diguanylate cyclase/phosphodiesterase [Halomonas rituensis]
MDIWSRRVFTPLTTLRGFVFLVILASSLAVFLGVTLAASLLYEDIMRRQASQTAENLAEQTFNSMFQVMRQGWTRDDLESFIDATKAAHENSPFNIEIYRGSLVTELYGAIEQPVMDRDIQNAFANGGQGVSHEEGVTRRIYPMVARDECLSCHTNANLGDVLGVIDIHHDMSPLTAEARQGYIILFMVVSLVVLFIAGMVSSMAARRVKNALDKFRQRLLSVNTVKDFRTLDVSDVDLHFQELNDAFGDINGLAQRLKDVAVDKDILEFEIRLLSKFIITSDVVRDWREFIKELLVDINTIIDAHSLITIFQVEDEGYEMEVFWYREPTRGDRELFETIVTRQLEQKPHFNHGIAVIRITHHSVCLSHLDEMNSDVCTISPEDIELQTKSLLLDAPRIGGVVGIGVQSEIAQDPIRHIVIDGILSTLLNLVGSVKAIYKYTQDLEYYATRDPLTALHNQRVFKDLLHYEIGRAQRHKESFSLLMLDMDNFKLVNDRHGHAFGDQFLQAFAKALHDSVRPGDFLSRYGGDEFTVILSDTGESQAYSVAQRITQDLARVVLMAPDGSPVRATTSVGIAVYPQHAEDPKDLFLLADNMMYKAKRMGKNCLALPEEDEVAAIYREVGEKNQMVLNALEEKRIVPYFQPIVDVVTGETHIHELLMRIEMDGRIIPAGEFIDIAESIGVVHRMDYLLIEKAFAQIHEQNYQGTLFINLSPRSLIISEFIGRIHQLALDYKIDSSRIVFELTERETVSNLKLLEQFVLDLKMQGFSFAIDDFGSGFSSFHYLKQFPIDVIKIEGEFIRNMLTDDKYMAFVKSIVTLAKSLKVATIAEFIEDQDVLDAVAELGIDYGQGYHLGRPVPEFMPVVAELAR